MRAGKQREAQTKLIESTRSSGAEQEAYCNCNCSCGASSSLLRRRRIHRCLRRGGQQRARRPRRAQLPISVHILDEGHLRRVALTDA